MGEMPAPKLVATRPATSTARQALEIYTLYGFAVAQPLYDLLSRGAEFLLAHRLQSLDLLALVAILSCLPPTVLLLME